MLQTSLKKPSTKKISFLIPSRKLIFIGLNLFSVLYNPMKKLILLIVICSVGLSSRAQQKEKVKSDSIIHQKTPKDSISKEDEKLFDTIQKRSDRTKIGRLLNKWVLRDPTDSDHNKTDDELAPKYEKDKGKIIRTIRIVTTDPFGYSLADTTKTPHSWFQKTGNAIHIKSKEMAIDKFILFKENESLNPYLIGETERLLREQNYIHQLRITSRPVENTKDSVDVYIQVMDSWSLLPKARISSSHGDAELLERNFIGMGHQLRGQYSRSFEQNQNGYEAEYRINNIRNTFIDFKGKYARDFDQYQNKYLSVSRRFYSQIARWAGGVFFQNRSLERPMPGDTSAFENQDLKFIYQDYWVGHAFPVIKDKERDQITNLTLGLRSFFLNYRQSPDKRYDSIHYFSNERFYLASISLNSRRFVQDKYIFKDGEVEDIPIGSLYGITGGIQQKYDKTRLYAGLQASYGSYFNWGFLSGNIEVGSFFNNRKPEQAAISFQINYFSKLIDLGNDWYLRQFIKPQLVLGFNRKDSFADRLSLNDEFYFTGVRSAEYINYEDQDHYVNYKTASIRGFESEAVGTHKFVVDFQTQVYAPWTIAGFHFNPFLDVTLGYLADKDHSFGSNKVYTGITAGVIIRNDYLVFDSFQLSLSYYPEMPGHGTHVIRSNAVRTHDYGLQSFEVTEPRTVIFE